MVLLFELSRNSLCHAFNALDTGRCGCVPKSRLLVFSASLGNLLGVGNVEKGLKEHRSTSYLKFPEFMFYLEKELFTSVPKDLSADALRKFLYDINDVCWLVCKSALFSPDKNKYPGESYYFKIFCIFCTVAEYTCKPDNDSSVTLSEDDVHYITDMFDDALGNNVTTVWDNKTVGTTNDGEDFSLQSFFSYMEKRYLYSYDKDPILEAVDEVYDVIVENVIKKGFLKKWLTPVGPGVRMWFILKQHSLSWYSNKNKKDLWGGVDFHGCKVEVRDGPGTQFSVVANNKEVCLSALDCSTKLQWTAAISVAITHSQTLEPLQRHRILKLRQSRKEAQLKLAEEKRLQLEQAEALQSQAQEKFELELQLQKEMERLKDMELKEKVLLIQLEEERRAKRDEEVVRNLQSRMLAEEWEKREALEKQQQQKEAELCEERRMREKLEEWQRKRQAEIEELNVVVTSLEKEKEQLHGTLKKTKMLLQEPKVRQPCKDTRKNLKRSVSADLSMVSSEKWSVSVNLAAGDDDEEY